MIGDGFNIRLADLGMDDPMRANLQTWGFVVESSSGVHYGKQPTDRLQLDRPGWPRCRALPLNERPASILMSYYDFPAHVG